MIINKILYGEVSEWLKVHAWNACMDENPSGVQISPSPQIKFIVIFLFLFSFVFSQSNQKIGSVSFIEGSCIVENSRIENRKSNLVLGSSIFKDDKIFSERNSECHILYDDGLTHLSISSNSNIFLFEDNFSRTIKMKFGSILIESSKTNIKTYVVTPSNEIYVNENKVWIESNSLLTDKIYSINSEINIYNYLSKSSNKILPLKKASILNDGSVSYVSLEEYPLPFKINKESLLRKKYLNDDIASIYLNPSDLIPNYDNKRKVGQLKYFNIDYNTGVRFMNSDSYLSLAVYPYYKNNNFIIGGNLEFFYGSNLGLLGNWDDISDIFEKIHISYSTSNNNNRLFVNAGRIDDITFGNGYLVKNLSNTFNYPYQRNFGINLLYEVGYDFIDLNFFIPSIRDYMNGGGILGFHTSLYMSHKFPLELGVGFVFDFNQFSLSSETYNFSNQNISNMSRAVSAMEIDFNYNLMKKMNLELNLFGEFVGIWFPNNIYYVQIDGPPYVDDVRYRKGAWGVLGPGIEAIINNKYKFKFAFNFNSAGFQPEYFNTNYLNNRSIYYNASNENLEFPLISEQIEMISEFDISENSDNTEFLIPKEIHPILSKTFNPFPVFGFTTEFGYNYDNIIDISTLLSLFIQNKTNTLDLIKEFQISGISTYYSIGAKISIKENVLRDVSFLDFYLSNVFFWSADDLDKMLYGIKMGFKLPLDLLLVFDLNQVFYDYNLINDKEKMINAGIEIKMDF